MVKGNVVPFEQVMSDQIILERANCLRGHLFRRSPKHRCQDACNHATPVIQVDLGFVDQEGFLIIHPAYLVRVVANLDLQDPDVILATANMHSANTGPENSKKAPLGS